jgi:hypothetical protein
MAAPTMFIGLMRPRAFRLDRKKKLEKTILWEGNAKDEQWAFGENELFSSRASPGAILSQPDTRCDQPCGIHFTLAVNQLLRYHTQLLQDRPSRRVQVAPEQPDGLIDPPTTVDPSV